MLAGASLAAGAPADARTDTLEFPRDFGAHPNFQTEWWYATGYINSPSAAAAWGFQVTFFRSRVAQTQDMQSAFAAKQLIFAHAALTDVAKGKLWHDQRIARWSGAPAGSNSVDTASASTIDTDVRLNNWRLQRTPSGLLAHVQALDFSLALTFTATQPVLLQGEQGLSRKGPDAGQTSYYYSHPQLRVQGDVVLQGRRFAVAEGSMAWLDHEWSEHMMHPQAIGWDWIGMNLLDGSTLTAFRLRKQDDSALWDGGSYRTGKDSEAGQKLITFARGDALFKPLRWWQSVQSKARYPVEWEVQTPVGTYTVRARLDNQELDSMPSTGAIYWEGLCDLFNAKNALVGRGYLEMTGYAAPIRL
jgi:predicted secreted hydrolase